MRAGPRLSLAALSLGGLLTLAACEAPSPQSPAPAPAPAAPDPDAPAPGSQAAEAIGLDAAEPSPPRP